MSRLRSARALEAAVAPILRPLPWPCPAAPALLRLLLDEVFTKLALPLPARLLGPVTLILLLLHLHSQCQIVIFLNTIRVRRGTLRRATGVAQRRPRLR